MVERLNRTLGNSLRALLDARADGEWDLLLPQIMRTLRATPHRMTQESPNYLMLGRETRLPPALVTDELAEEPVTPEQYAAGLQERVQAAGKAVLELQRGTPRIEGGTEPSLFKEGDSVWLRSFFQGKGRGAKLRPKYVGPYIVEKVLEHQTYRVKREGRRTTQHVGRMKRYVPPEDRVQAPSVEERTEAPPDGTDRPAPPNWVEPDLYPEETEDGLGPPPGAPPLQLPEPVVVIEPLPVVQPPPIEEAAPILRRSQRERRPPNYLGDFIAHAVQQSQHQRADKEAKVQQILGQDLISAGSGVENCDFQLKEKGIQQLLYQDLSILEEAAEDEASRMPTTSFHQPLKINFIALPAEEVEEWTTPMEISVSEGTTPPESACEITTARSTIQEKTIPSRQQVQEYVQHQRKEIASFASGLWNQLLTEDCGQFVLLKGRLEEEAREMKELLSRVALCRKTVSSLGVAASCGDPSVLDGAGDPLDAGVEGDISPTPPGLLGSRLLPGESSYARLVEPCSSLVKNTSDNGCP